jgi:hypothetical protein
MRGLKTLWRVVADKLDNAPDNVKLYKKLSKELRDELKRKAPGYDLLAGTSSNGTFFHLQTPPHASQRSQIIAQQIFKAAAEKYGGEVIHCDFNQEIKIDKHDLRGFGISFQ